MSTWSEDNFGSDAACDYLSDILYKLLEAIDETLNLSKDIDIFFFGEARLMPACDIMVTLGKAYPTVVHSFLENKPIAEWRDQYLKVFDAEAGDVMDDDFKRDRRQIITTTFSDLIKLVDEY